MFCAKCGKGTADTAEYCASCGTKIEQRKSTHNSSSAAQKTLLLFAVSFLLIASPGLWVAFSYTHGSISLDETFWGLQGAGFILAGIAVLLGSRHLFGGQAVAPAILASIGLALEGMENLVFYTNNSAALSTSGWQKFNYLLMGLG